MKDNGGIYFLRHADDDSQYTNEMVGGTMTATCATIFSDEQIKNSESILLRRHTARLRGGIKICRIGQFG
jgi:hypothetical protein